MATTPVSSTSTASPITSLTSPPITSQGIGSGLDIQGIVQKLVAADGAAETYQIQKKQTDYQAKLSMYSAIKGALSDFQTTFGSLKFTSTFHTLSATSSNPSAFTATASNSAQLGNYSVEVNQLAQSQQLNSSAAFADKNSTVIGTGTLTLNLGKYTYDSSNNVTGFTPDASSSAVKINITNGTLEGIRDSINNANAGVSASIINDPSQGYKLVLTSATGENKAINISTTDAGLTQLAYDPTGKYGTATTSLTETQQAKSANATINGVAITSDTNTITNAVDNVSFNLTGVTTQPETLSITRDTSTVQSSVQAFVDGYNKLMQVVNSATFYDPNTGNTGILIGDSTVRNVVNQMRSVLNHAVNNDPTAKYNSLASLGITTAQDGTLQLDSSKLTTALSEAPDQVQYLIAGGQATTTSNAFTVQGVTDNIPAGNYSVSYDGSNTATVGGEAATVQGGIITGSGQYAGFKLALNNSPSSAFNATIKVNQGAMSSLNSLLTSFLDSGGLITSKTDGLNASLKELAKQQTALSDHLATLQAQYSKQFNAMDTLVAQLNSTGSFLTNQLSNLPGARKGG